MTPPTHVDTAPEGNLGGRSRFTGLVYDFAAAGERTPEQISADMVARWAKPQPHLSRQRRMIIEYREARDAWEAAREAAALGYDTENRDFQVEHPSPTLGQFMRDFR